MYTRVEKIFIGKAMDRTSSAVVFPYLNGGSAIQAASEGEIFVLDKNKNILAAGSTVSDSNTIYIAEVTGVSQTYANAEGTSITAKTVLISDPIDGSKVTNYSAKAYAAKVERTAAFTLANTTAGREVAVRIVYNDVIEHPGQFTHTYRYFQSGTAATDATALTAIINKHTGRRVTASVSSATVTLTALAIPECTSSLTNIDKFSMVDFEVFIWYVDTAGSRVDYNLTITYNASTTGSGNWAQVRDAEKYVITNQFGPTNRTYFPVVQPTIRTVKDITYNTINIESYIPYRAADSTYKKSPISTKIFLNATTTTNGQTATILAVLNPWMESAGFESISF